MDAYALLGVEHSASPAEIRHAYKRRAREHHPDRHPANSPEQRVATERMTAINEAYQVVRDAPLRHHRVSTGARPDDPWTDAELDSALRTARHDRVLANVITAITVAFLLFLPLLIQAYLSQSLFKSPVTLLVVLVYATVVIVVGRGGGSSRLWELLYLFRFLTRF